MLQLSIIIPMFNVEKYIERCVISLLNQDLDKNVYEIIIIDDGSTDNSLKIAQEFAQMYSNIFIFTQNNSGQSSARNFGISLAKGSYLYFVDSDDYIACNTLSDVLKEAIKNNLEIITFDLKRISSGESIIHSLKKDQLNEITNGIDYIYKYSYNNSPCYFFVKSDFLKKNQIFFRVGRFCEDVMFTTTVLLKSVRIAYFPIDVYRYVKNPNSTTTKNDKSHSVKVINDFIFTIDFFDSMLLQYKNVSDFYKIEERLFKRRDSYVFFLLARIIKAGIDLKSIRKILRTLQEKKVYPMKNFYGNEYSGFIFYSLNRMFNLKVVYFSMCIIYKLFSGFRK
jgi:glycosyltransferase involved in cell wall biosynthesis